MPRNIANVRTLPYSHGGFPEEWVEDILNQQDDDASYEGYNNQFN